MTPADLFEFYKRGDEANCFYCGFWLNWRDMRPTAWGEQYRENVCSACRAEEVANGGYMIRDEVHFKARQERREALLTNITDKGEMPHERQEEPAGLVRRTRSRVLRALGRLGRART